jgi:hypothetical protein
LGLSTVNQPGGSEYRVKVFTGAFANRRDLLLWQFPGYGSRIASGLLEGVSEPEEEMARKARGRQGNRGAKSMVSNFC